jgi:WD40 repeat protein
VTEHGTGLPGINWSDADLRGKDLRNAVLDGARLLGADLRGAHLAGCRLRRAAMIGALVDPGALDNSDTFGAALPDSPVEQQFAPGHAHTDHLAAAPARGLLAAAGTDGGVWIWADGPWRPVRRFVDAARNVTALAFSPQETVLAIGAHASVLVRDLVSGEVRTLTDEATWIRCITFDPSGRYLAATGDDGMLRVWATDTWQLAHSVAAADGPAYTVAFNNDLVAVGGFDDRVVRVWAIGTWNLVRELKVDVHGAITVTFPAAGRIAAEGSVGWDSRRDTWNTKTWKRVHREKIPGDDYSEVDPTAEVSVPGMTVRAYRGGELSMNGQKITVPNLAAGRVAVHGDLIVTCAEPNAWIWTAEGRRVLPGADVGAVADGAVVVWDVATGKRRRRMPTEDYVVSVAFSPDGSTLAACGRHWTYRWDTTTWQPLGHRPQWASLVDFATDGTFLTAWGTNVEVNVWRDDELTVLPQDGRYPVLAFSPGGSTLAVALSAAVHVWDIAGQRRVHTLEGGTKAVVFSPDGTRLATGGKSRGIRIWDLASGKRLGLLTGHLDEVQGLAFRDDRTLVSGGGDGVRIWDLESGTCRRHLFPDGPGATWFAAGLCRFEPGELDSFRRAPRST